MSEKHGDGLIYVGEGEYLPGIPARDLSGAEVARLSASQLQRMADSGLYSGEPPTPVAELPNVGAEIGEALAAVGLETIADVRGASDEQLLAVSGIGPARLKQIRAAISEV